MKFVVFRDAGLLWRWRLVSRNGKIIADSGEGYESKANARRAARRLAVVMSPLPEIELPGDCYI